MLFFPNNIKKRIRNMKMQLFVWYLTVQIVLTETKTSVNTVFPQLLKIMAKKACEKGKVVRSNFQERFN